MRRVFKFFTFVFLLEREKKDPDFLLENSKSCAERSLY